MHKYISQFLPDPTKIPNEGSTSLFNVLKLRILGCQFRTRRPDVRMAIFKYWIDLYRIRATPLKIIYILRVYMVETQCMHARCIGSHYYIIYRKIYRTE